MANFVHRLLRDGNDVSFQTSGTQFRKLSDRVVVTVPIDSATVDGNIFIADRAYTVASVEEVHSTAGSDASAVTLAVKKCSGTTAPASGTAVHASTANLKGTANTVQSLTVNTDGSQELADGDRLAIDVTGTLTALAGGVLVVVLRPI